MFEKYISLIHKDIIVAKSSFVFLALSLLFPLILPQELLVSNYYVPAVMIITFASLLVSVGPLWQEEKNKGIELLLSTSCTRKNVVMCRYLALIFAVLINLIFYFGAILLLTNQLVFLNFAGVILFFVTCLSLSLIVPISFKFKAMTTSIIESIIFCPIIVIFETIKIENTCSLFVSMSIILFSILLIILSMYVSLRIYRNKDL